MHKLFILFVIFGVTATSLSARTVRAIFLQPPAGAPDKAFLFTGSKSSEIELPSRNLSSEITIPNGELTLAILQASLPEGTELPKDVQTIKIPAAWRRCLLIFLPAPKRSVFPANVLLVNSSDANLPKGNTLIYNLSNSIFLGKFGELPIIQVRPRKTGIVKPPIKGDGHFPIAIDCILPEAQERTTICRTNWVHNPDARQILFVVHPPGQKIPRVWGVLDRKDEKKEVEQ